VSAILQDLYETFFGASLVIAPGYLLLAVAAAWLVYRGRRMSGGFWRWLVPKDIYLHQSHLIDIQLFAISRGFAAFGILGALTLTTVIAAFVARIMPTPILAPQSLGPVMLALILWVPTDFANYWMHRFYHRWSAIWPLHAVHHSAEVLTPFTTYRQHPVGIVVSTLVQSAIIGGVQGVLVGALSPETAVAQIAGINACFVLANGALAALHHSHVWLSYGPVLERLIISPAQHQIHHSCDPAHYGKNFGNSLAVWDWVFGTLYIVRGNETLTFGLAEDVEKPLMAQRLGPILWDPIRRMLRLAG
jgi:sterol desaturase/sphingolipid hydroxylase (fatty acid hydroxylase superfamily)